MTRIAVFVVLLLAALTAAKTKKKFPPNGFQHPTEEQIKKMPKQAHDPRHRGVTMIPDSFDARVKWPKCKSISTIRNQGQCGTCWAVAGASVLSDRICVASGQANADIFISADQAASCSQPTRSATDNCQAGGDAQNVYKHATLYGVATGGEFNSDVGCVPYSVSPRQALPISCSKTCTNTDYPTPMAKDNKVVDGYWTNYKPANTKMTQAEIDEAVKQMQLDIMTSGPMSVSITVFEDFQDWEPPAAPYCNPSAGSANKGGHAVRVIGWGKSAKGVKYWLIANSWGEDAGDKGVYQIEMGKNCVGVERTLSAPIVTIPNTCVTASFCDTPIDQAIQSVPTDPKSPIYLFQGNCTQQVTVSVDGKMTPVGPAVPLSKQFIGAPSGPITSFIIQNNELWIINKDGKAGAKCAVPKDATKLSCGGGSGTPGQVAQAIIPGNPVSKWSWYPDNADWFFNTQGSGTNLKGMVTTTMNSVDAMLNVDGKKMIVFGKDKTGKPVSGVASYPSSTQAGFAWVTKPGPLKNLMTKC